MDTWEAVGVVVAALVGAAGLVVGLVAGHQARNANKLAQRSNDIAAGAVREAKDANRIAEEANKLSEHANKVVTLEAAQRDEQWLVEWDVQWEGKDCVARFVNHGRDAALDTLVSVRGDDVDKLHRGPDEVAHGEGINVGFPEFLEERRVENPRRRDHIDELRRSGFFYNFEAYTVETVVTIHWRTNLGQPRQQVLHLTLK